ncbi:MAG: anthranilate phosphoribosyltransferase [Chitinivibrionales bacterium]|nr:anthranilate phosphoribosyltransferase [Chitinivibrionales bacterium]
MIQEAIQKIIEGKSLSTEETREVFTAIMSGDATEAQIGALIVALRIKGETIEEITGAAEVMRDKATHVMPSTRDHVIDTCGTGGDRSNSFNISTATAFVAAGAGAVVAKHGNRSVSSKSGSADVLEALGVAIAAGPEVMKACLDDIGICFLFAPTLHKAMKYAIGPRKQIGVRTIFNILGPLTNPSMAESQILGVFSPNLPEPLANVLKNMGSKKAYVVHGDDGLDEISISGPTTISELKDGQVATYTIEPGHFGIDRAGRESITGGDARKNASIIRDILGGTKGPCRNIVVLNSAFAIAASGLVDAPEQGMERAVESIDSGKAAQKLEKLIEASRSWRQS